MKLPKQSKPVLRSAVHNGQTIGRILPSKWTNNCGCLLGTYCPPGNCSMRDGEFVCLGGCKILYPPK